MKTGDKVIVETYRRYRVAWLNRVLPATYAVVRSPELATGLRNELDEQRIGRNHIAPYTDELWVKFEAGIETRRDLEERLSEINKALFDVWLEARVLWGKQQRGEA